jgi:hypothetical protein
MRLLPGFFATTLFLTCAPGCGDGGTPGAGGSGATTASVTATTATTTGTGGDDGNNDFATAETLTVGTPIDAYLEPWSDQDFYVFQGKKGQALSFTIKAEEMPFDPYAIDTVLTLYDASRQQIAENNAPTPRLSDDAQLFTLLPADGAYYLRVAECWSLTTDGVGCAKPRTKLSTAYTLRTVSLAGVAKGVVLDPETGNDFASATPVTYADAVGGVRPPSVVYGRFEGAADVDVFSFDVPADPVELPPGARLLLNEWLLREGPFGDGSTGQAGKIYLTTQADPTTRLAQIDGADHAGTGARMWPPIDPAGKYYLFVERPQATAGANDFYINLHGAGRSNPLEQKDAENDAAATAEALTPADNGSFYVEGDLGNAAADVDHFAFDVADQAGKKVYAICVSARAGSGLGGFQIALLDATTFAPLSTVIETATADAVTDLLPVPGGAAKMILELRATTQDPIVVGAFYRCGIHFQ